MGGVWERQIRSVCNVLSSLLQTNGFQFNHEALTTFMCEAEAIVNSRPLTTDSLNNPTSLNPLTPNHLLTMKTKVLLPPPFVFQAPDKYRRKHWRRVQHLPNEFWIRWKKEYLPNLQQGQKWNKPRRNAYVDDIVFIKDDESSLEWPKLIRVLTVMYAQLNLLSQITHWIKGADVLNSADSWNAPCRNSYCYKKQVRPEVHPQRGATNTSSFNLN